VAHFAALVDWLLVEANWRGTSREDCTSAGACWVFIRARFAQFMYGQYPVPERWRVDLFGRAGRGRRGGALVARPAAAPRGAIAMLVGLPLLGHLAPLLAASACRSSRRANGAG